MTEPATRGRKTAWRFFAAILLAILLLLFASTSALRFGGVLVVEGVRLPF